MAFAPDALLRRIRSRVRHTLGVPAPWTTRSLVGRQLEVREGTLPTAIDYDDAWVFACAQHATIAFDLGANVGQSALLMLLGGSIQQIVLVEPNGEALSAAAGNLIRNQLSPAARFIAAFAADSDDAVVDLWTVGTGAAGSMYPGHAVTAAREGSVQKVPTITLDTIVARTGLVPDFVKVDVEGAEAKVLDGGAALAAKRVARFLVEMHSPAELPMRENARLVLEWCTKHGYAAWYLADKVRLDTPERIAHRGRCHLLLQPADWPLPEWLASIAQSAPLPT